MPSSLTLDCLQWTITLSGVIGFLLALRTLHIAISEHRALISVGINGGMRAAALHHVVTSSTRMVAALVSVSLGYVLTVLPDFVTGAGLIAGIAWLTYNLLMCVNLSFEWWAWNQARTCKERT